MTPFIAFIPPAIAYLAWDVFPKLARLSAFVAVIEIVVIFLLYSSTK